MRWFGRRHRLAAAITPPLADDHEVREQAVRPGRISARRYPVTVSYDLSLAEMIDAGGYDWSNPNIIAESFPVGGAGEQERELVLVNLGRHASSTEEVLAEIDRQGLRPAVIEELLAFGAAYPDKQREFPIVALGSVWLNPYGDSRHVSGLWGRSEKRELDLHAYEGHWFENYHFAAACN